MRTTLFAVLALCVSLGDTQAAEPGIDDLLTRITDIRKQRAELDKQEAAAKSDLDKKRREQQERYDALFGPQPKPPEPKPSDPLRDRLKPAYDADPAQLDKRAAHAKDLAELYRQGAGYATDPATKSSGDLLTRVREASATVIGPTALVAVRKAVAAELGALLPTDEPLTDLQRADVVALFTRLAAILDALAG